MRMKTNEARKVVVNHLLVKYGYARTMAILRDQDKVTALATLKARLLIKENK